MVKVVDKVVGLFVDLNLWMKLILFDKVGPSVWAITAVQHEDTALEFVPMYNIYLQFYAATLMSIYSLMASQVHGVYTDLKRHDSNRYTRENTAIRPGKIIFQMQLMIVGLFSKLYRSILALFHYTDCILAIRLINIVSNRRYWCCCSLLCITPPYSREYCRYWSYW